MSSAFSNQVKFVIILDCPTMVWSRKAGPLEQPLDHLLPKMPSSLDLPTYATDIKQLLYHYFTLARMTNLTIKIFVFRKIAIMFQCSIIVPRMANISRKSSLTGNSKPQEFIVVTGHTSQRQVVQNVLMLCTKTPPHLLQLRIKTSKGFTKYNPFFAIYFT